MDESCHMKCCSSPQWQSLMPSILSSSTLQAQEPRNQMWNAGLYFYPPATQESRPASCGMTSECMVPKTANSCSDSSGHADLGSSFMPLLAGPTLPSLPQCDLLQFSSRKPILTPSFVPASNNSFTIGIAGNGVSVAPTAFFPQTLTIENPKLGANACPVLPSRVVTNPSYGSGPTLLDVLQAANLNHQNTEPAKPNICHSVASDEKTRDISSVRGGCLSSSNTGRLHAATLVSHKALTPVSQSVCHWSSNLAGCPRVYCLGASGDLLISNTGLLGVVCLCHGLHMSISKFSKHSGLSDVNPGDAVRMDTGETIAQWRNLYFHKFGIRAVEDHNGWDWPDEFSTSGMVRCNVTAPNISKSSELSNVVSFSSGLVGSGQTQNDGAFHKNPNAGYIFVHDVSNNQKQRNLQNSCGSVYKGLIRNSISNLPAAENSQILGCPVSRCVTMSKFLGARGSDNGFHSSSAYLESTSISGQSFTPRQHLQNLKFSCVDSDVSRFYNLNEGNILENDVMSSSTELRLGQPSPHSEPLRNPVFPAVRSLYAAVGDQQKPHLPEQFIHNRKSRIMEEISHHLDHAGGLSNSGARRGQSQLNLVKDVPGVNNTRDGAINVHLKGDAARNSAIPILLSQFKFPVDGKLHSKDTSGIVSGSHATTETLPCEPSVINYDPTAFQYSRGNGMETPLSANRFYIQSHVDKGKKIAVVADGLQFSPDPNFEFLSKHIENTSNCDGIGGTSHHNYSVAYKSSLLHQSSGMPTCACDAGNPVNNSGRVSSFGFNRNLDHVCSRFLNFPMDSRQDLPLQASSLGSPVTTSTLRSNALVALSNKELRSRSPYLLDENLKMLAVRQVTEVPNEGNTVASFRASQDQGRLNICGDKVQGSLTNPLSLEEQKSRLPRVCKQDNSEVSTKYVQPCFTRWMGADAENLASVASLKKWSSFSTFSPASSFCSKNSEIHCQLSCDSHQQMEPSGRTVNEVTPNECGRCCQRVPNSYLSRNCGCSLKTNFLGGSCNSKCETIVNASKELVGNLNDVVSMLVDPKFKDSSILPSEKAVSFDRSGHLGAQVNKVDNPAFQWRDVPSKVRGGHNSTCKDRPSDLLDKNGSFGNQITAAKCFDRSIVDADCSKEQETSNVSSGCSAPAITQASVQLNKFDSSTIDAGDVGTQDLAVDEGSGIDKCWSSDGPLGSEKSSEFLGITSNCNSANKGSSNSMPNQSSRSLIDELRLRDSLILKSSRNPANSGFSILRKINHAQKFEKAFKPLEGKQPIKWKMLQASSPRAGLSSAHKESIRSTGSSYCHSYGPRDLQMLLQSDRRRSDNCEYSGGPSSTQRPMFCSSKTMNGKRGFNRICNDREGESDLFQPKADDDHSNICDKSGRKRFRLDQTSPQAKHACLQEPDCTDTGVISKSNAADCMIASSGWVGICKRKDRPIVCGKYGVIYNGNSVRPVKIVPLEKILRATGRSECNKLKSTSAKTSGKRNIRGNNKCMDKFSNFKKRESEGHDELLHGDTDPSISTEETEMGCFSGAKDCDSDLSDKDKDDRNKKDHGNANHCLGIRLKPKYKKVRKRSLYELSIKGVGSSRVDVSTTEDSKFVSQRKCIYQEQFLKEDTGDNCHADGICIAKSTKVQHCKSSLSNLDVFCCVCGSLNNDDTNCLLECGLCLIKVHQACYGVSRVPRNHWYCRPCQTNSKNIVCVLCGYGGGAMTRALQSENIVKSLLKAWNIIVEPGSKNTTFPSEALEDGFNMLSSPDSKCENGSLSVIKHVPIQSSSVVVSTMDMCKQLDSRKKSPCFSNLKFHNSIAAGLLDSTVKQWVHMVCGLWTPGTRCPNVNTMSAFDVSGAFCPDANTVCSICNRQGGSCIQCRVHDCSVHFHPWCAHQKGLLQSEVEGVDNENVGFYGRCVLHATCVRCTSDADPIGSEMGHPGDKEYTCVRTEGYKGRKREGFRHNSPHQSNGKSGCVVPQEQLNAWLHINRQMSRTKGLPKMPASDVEHDCRKEYARYKQSKGWKHLVVYKSGIHALGLYTAQFISRGAMVVEYVGEIVGLRVADKRENEYQSGRKLQYKSACYFFRIDKEHIIDATRKGGIARFVNHSCLPNCVAKVISVRNEKKVVFFAERDIYPGEEITYDYHFNHEDEGKKIPCSCNSKNCRRYLN